MVTAYLADFDYLGIGSNNAGESVAHTDLQTSVKRKQGTPTQETTTQTDDTYSLIVAFSSADSLSGTVTIQEGGVFDAASSGNMLFRKNGLGKAVDWDAGDTLTVTATCQVKQGS